jgi:hypothetical protein
VGMKNMKITPIIINGRHGGTILPLMEYIPTIRLPITDKSQISIGEKYDKSVRVGDYEEYQECFRSVDKQCVMYSTNGYWSDIKYALLSNTRPTYPVDFTRITPPIY